MSEFNILWKLIVNFQLENVKLCLFRDFLLKNKLVLKYSLDKLRNHFYWSYAMFALMIFIISHKFLHLFIRQLNFFLVWINADHFIWEIFDCYSDSWIGLLALNIEYKFISDILRNYCMYKLILILIFLPNRRIKPLKSLFHLMILYL